MPDSTKRVSQVPSISGHGVDLASSKRRHEILPNQQSAVCSTTPKPAKGPPGVKACRVAQRFIPTRFLRRRNYTNKEHFTNTSQEEI